MHERKFSSRRNGANDSPRKTPRHDARRYYYIVITLLIKAAARSQTRSRLAWQKHGEEAHEINIPQSNLVNN
jgi:hypothetical protein